MKIGDFVTRNKYNNDIVFEICDIIDDVYYLRGVEFRLIADSQVDDLKISELSIREDDSFSLIRGPSIKGKVLHLDGDQRYLDMCKKKYDELKIRADCYYFKEEEFKNNVLGLLEKHRPQILVITGHDALRKDKDKTDINNYQHSFHFVETIKIARNYQEDKDELIIIAGACQSYYELLLASGANFASSPKRINIHALDPLYIASLVASENVRNYVDVEAVVSKTTQKESGMGGIDTKGVARKIYPTGG